MRLYDLAVRLAAVETKLATLTGTVANTDIIDDVNEFDQRLSIVEVQVNQLIALKTQEQIAAIVAAPATEVAVALEQVVVLSPSANDAEAVMIVEDVIQAQIEAIAIENAEIAVVVSAAIAAVVTADPEVVKDPEAVTILITEAVAETPVPSADAVQAVADAVAVIVAAATGEEVTPEVKKELDVAIVAPADPILDSIEERLAIAEAKADNLLGKLFQEFEAHFEACSNFILTDSHKI
mgnify:CR=1 FL=1